jgi:2-methylcitrate dehydratase PrpD
VSIPASTTRILADFVASIDYERLPAELTRRVTRQCLDLVGVALAGSGEPAAQAVRRLAGAPGPVSVWGTPAMVRPADAAFANATAGHALDFDDMWLPGAHPSAPIFPAAFAVAEAGGSSGRDLIAAQAAGYEVMGRLHSAVSGRFGWHPTGVFGTFGAAAAASRLLGLSGERTAAAFGIASSMASGIDGQSGTMTKPLHAGLAAQSGVRAALLAADGFTATESAFEGRRSFFASFFPGVTPQTWRLTSALGSSYYPLNPGIGIKMYPAGYYMHQSFEAALGIVTAEEIAADDISSIRIAVHGPRFSRPFPKSSLDAKFSVQYMAVMAVLYRRLTADLFDEKVLFSEPVQSLLARTTGYDERDLPDNPDIAHNPVTITCTDGREFTLSVTMPQSHWNYPLPREAWLGKFRANASRVLAGDAVDGLVDAFDQLEQAPDVHAIAALLRRSAEADQAGDVVVGQGAVDHGGHAHLL